MTSAGVVNVRGPARFTRRPSLIPVACVGVAFHDAFTDLALTTFDAQLLSTTCNRLCPRLRSERPRDKRPSGALKGAKADAQ